MTHRPRLTPAMADVRRAVRENLDDLTQDSLVLVALSGGPDSLALASGLAFEASKLGLRAGAVIVDHGLQDGSAQVARQAAAQAEALGLDPVLIRAVQVVAQSGPEADARAARYAAFEEVATEVGATAIVLGHTLDDQAETVLLGLTRGSGATSLAGMSTVSGIYRRPLLGIRRTGTVAACADQNLSVWNDPHNVDPSYTRVRIRTQIMPMLEKELGPGIAEALARTADQLQQDADVLDALAAEVAATAAEVSDGILKVSVSSLAAQTAAIRQRVIRMVVLENYGVSLSAKHTEAIARLVTNWHGQSATHLPGIRVERQGAELVFTMAPSVESEVAKD